MSLYSIDNKSDYNLECIDKRVVITTSGSFNVVTNYFDTSLKYRIMFLFYVWRVGTVLPYTPCTISNIQIFQSVDTLFTNETLVSNDLIVGAIPDVIDFSATTDDDLTTLLNSFGIEYTERYVRLSYDITATVTGAQTQQNPIIINLSSISEPVIT